MMESIATTPSHASAFVIGASGEVGKELVKELVNSNTYSKLIIIGRRQLDDEPFNKVEQVLVDFDKLEEHKSVFEGLEVGFCCLGTTRGKAGSAGFVKVDHDYVVSAAKVAKEAGCKHFSVVSSTGANKNSLFLYPQIKGLMEHDLAQLGFERLSIFQPSMLLCDRRESRPMERLAMFALRPISYAFPTLMTVPTICVAKAMVHNALSPSNKQVEIINNKTIHAMAKDRK